MASGIEPLFFLTEPVASLTHLGGAVGGLIALPFLLRAARGDRVLQACLGVFAFTVIGLLSVSGLYHLCEIDGAARAVYRRLDHVGIWMTTAGCATPIWYFYLRRSRMGTPFLVLVWVAAIAAALTKTVYLDELVPWAGVLLFVAFGSVGTPVAIWLVVKRGLRFTLPFFLCGVSLSVGALVEMIEEPVLVPGVVEYHELVHVLVMSGLFFHWRFLHKATAESKAAPAIPPPMRIKRTEPQPVSVHPDKT